MKIEPIPANRLFHVYRWRLALLGVVATLALAPCCSGAEAEEGISEQDQAVATSSHSPEGRQMLAVTLVLAGALIGMERVCSWRLGVNQRSTAANQGLAAVLPSIRLADSPSLMSSRSPSRGNVPE